MFYNDSNTFLATVSNTFVIIELFDLNLSSNILFEIFSTQDFLVDFLMCLCISFMALKVLKFSSSGLILINTLPSSFSIAFCLCISYFYYYNLIHQLLLLIYTHENKDHFCSIGRCIELAYFFPSNASVIDSNTVCSLQLITSCSLNRKFL